MSGIDCRVFERRLDGLLDGTHGQRERVALERHAESCNGCRELLQLADAPQPQVVDITDSVLSRTSGASCSAAHERLSDYVDTRLDALDTELVRQHLGVCRNCDGLASTLAELSTDLPLLAERAVDERFLGEVLARTSGRRRFARWSLLLSGWQRLLARPRFALEAAYVMTALVVLIVGIPSAPIAGVSRRAFEVTAADLRPGLERSVNEARSSVSARAREAWGSTSTRISVDAQSRVDEVAELSSAVAEDIRHGVGTLWGRFASGETNEDDNRSTEQSDRQEGDEP